MEQEIFGLVGFRNKATCHVKEVVGEAIERRTQGDETLNCTPHYVVYGAGLGKGNSPVFIFTNTFDKIQLGDSDLWLRHICFEDAEQLFFSRMELPRSIVKTMCKGLGIPTVDENKHPIDTESLIQDIFEADSNNPCIFTLTTGLPAVELDKLTDERANELVKLWLEGGYEKDKLIITCFKAAVPLGNIVLVRKIGDLMPYQPHFIFFSNTKVGKSFTAEKVGENLTRGSVANLLGFSTGNEINRGSLDGETRMVTLDELQEERRTDLLGQLLNIMEGGEAVISVGKQRIRTKFYGYLGFLGNPKKSEDTEDFVFGEEKTREKALLAIKMVEMLKKATLNYPAYGSRIGLIIFDANLSRSTAKEAMLNAEEKNALDCIVETLRLEIRDQFTRVFYDTKTIAWLNKSFGEDYKVQVNKAIKAITFIPISEFLKGHLESYKHLRGMALRLAVVERISSVRRHTIPVEEILSLAEEKFKQLCVLNIKSFKNISDAVDETAIADYHKFLFDNLPAYQAIIVKAIVKWSENNSDAIGKATTIQITALHEYVIEELRVQGSTMSVNRVWGLSFGAAVTSNKRLEEFGLQLEEINGVQTIVVNDWVPLKHLIRNGVDANKLDVSTNNP
ncbi:MAG: hypothetical protein WCI04_02135 [archaeon]